MSFDHFWPELFKLGFVHILRTPVVVVRVKGKTHAEFFTERDFHDWEATEGQKLRSWTHEYYKGLSQWETDEFAVFLENLDKYLFKVTMEDETDKDAIDLAFNGAVWMAARLVELQRAWQVVGHERREIARCLRDHADIGRRTRAAARGFDGYKAHTAVDPDSEIITATTVTPGNAGDASVAEDLIADLLGDQPGQAEPKPAEPKPAGPEVAGPEVGESKPAGTGVAESSAGEDAEQAAVYGDNAYGTGSFHDRLGQAGIEDRCKTQAPTAAGGLFSKDRFGIDLDAGAVTCPGGITAPIRPARAGGGTAYFASACPGCPLRTQCTTAAGGRTVSVGPHEQTLTDARARQADPAWVADYRGTRPKVERKLGHLMRRRHGGRRARVRGTARVAADFRLLAAAVNLARMAVLDLRGSAAGWAVAV